MLENTGQPNAKPRIVHDRKVGTGTWVKKKILIVYNPTSGRPRAAKDEPLLRGLLSERGYQVAGIDAHAKNLQESIAVDQYGAIMVLGGDGTLRAVIQYLADQKADVPIIIVPRGSGNLMAKSLGMPSSCAASVELLEKGISTAIDVARTSSGEYFAGAFALGYLSHRVTQTSQNSKNKFGFGGYLWSFLKQTKLPRHHLTFQIDGKDFALDGHSLFIVNATNLFGFHSRRVGDFRDGTFELVVTTNRSFMSLVGLVIDFYFRRTAPKHFFLESGKHFVIDNAEALSTQLDGEPVQSRGRLEIQVLPLQQRFIIPSYVADPKKR